MPPSYQLGTGDLVTPAPFLDRVAARLVDLVVVLLAIGIVVSVVAVSYDFVVFPEFENGVAVSYLLGSALAAASLFIVYEAWATSWRGQSLGKRNVGLEILRISDGQTPPLLESFARTAIPPGTCLCVYGIATALTARWPFIYGAAT